jgi:iron complex outermembrane receptor protein
MTSCIAARTPGPSSALSSFRRPIALAALWATAFPLVLSAPSLAQTTQQDITELPEVTVTTTAQTPKKKPGKATPAQATAAPASAAPDQPAPGARSGSLSVPTTAEAAVEIERTPGAVEVVSDNAYRTSTPSVTLKDALDYVPGVFVQTKWGDDSRLSIRGSGLSRNVHGRGVQLLMDGLIPITTADGASDFQEIDPTAYRYIEVYKGANALRYGATQLGGAINFVMPTGYDADLFGVRLDVGSFGFHKAAVSSGAVSGAVDYFASVTAQETDGFRDHSDGEAVKASMNIGYRLSPDVETRFYLNANRVRQRIPGAVTKEQALTNPEGAFVLPGTPTTMFGQGNDNVDRDYQRNLDTFRVANKTSVRMAPGTVVEFGAFYFDRHLDHPILFVLDNQHDEYGGFGRIVDESVLGVFKNRFIAGVSLHNGDIRSRRYENNLGVRGDLTFDADQESTNTIVYAENSLFVLPSLALVAGLQYVDATREQTARFNASSGEGSYDFWNPKVGFVWDVTRTAQVFGNISRSGEAPTFSEITIGTSGTTSLEVQRATTYEIGTRGHLPGFNWDLALYRANTDNEFQCYALGASGTCTQVNLDKTIHQGVELGFGARLWSGLLETLGRRDELWLNTAYTFNDFRFDNDVDWGDNELPGVPRHFVRAELLYKHPSGVYFGPNIEWVPEAFYVDSANSLDTDAYALLGAKIGFDNGGPITAYIEGRNLTDEAYISSASIAVAADENSALFEPGSGRAIYGGVQVKW